MEYDRAVGEAAGRLSLTMRVNFEALAYRVEAYDAALDAALQTERRAGSRPVPGSLQLEVGAARWLPAGGLTTEVTGTEQVYTDRTLSAIQQSLRGSHTQSISAILREQYDLRLAQARIFPGWLPRLPLLGSRIHIIYPWETGS